MAGAKLAVKDSVPQAKGLGSKPYENTIRGLLAQGVKFYLCARTRRVP